MSDTIFDRIPELREKLNGFFQHRKKVSALDNYSSCAQFSLIKRCLRDAFLDEKESGFLDYMLVKYEIEYLDWAHKTRWLKAKMARMALKQPETPQISFDFEKRLNVPVSGSCGFYRPQNESSSVRRAV